MVGNRGLLLWFKLTDDARDLSSPTGSVLGGGAD
jgi:hypothetical protein